MHPFRNGTSTNGNLEPIDWDSPDMLAMRAEEIDDDGFLFARNEAPDYSDHGEGRTVKKYTIKCQ